MLDIKPIHMKNTQNIIHKSKFNLKQQNNIYV